MSCVRRSKRRLILSTTFILPLFQFAQFFQNVFLLGQLQCIFQHRPRSLNAGSILLACVLHDFNQRRQCGGNGLLCLTGGILYQRTERLAVARQKLGFFQVAAQGAFANPGQLRSFCPCTAYKQGLQGFFLSWCYGYHSFLSSVFTAFWRLYSHFAINNMIHRSVTPEPSR